MAKSTYFIVIYHKTQEEPIATWVAFVYRKIYKIINGYST